VKWREEMRVPLHSAPTVSGGRLFAVTDDNEMIAMNAATGDVIWTYQGIVETARMLTAPAPAVVGEVVIAPFASGELIAMRVQNGSVLWQDALSSGGAKKRKTRVSWAGPVLAGERLLLFSSLGDGVELNPYTGAISREFKVGEPVFVPPIIANETVYVLTDEAKVIAYK